MNRLSRLMAIQTQLQARRVVRAKDIAERFDISLRTVYRDIRALKDAGIPISGEAGQGYYLIDGFTLPPVSFTEEEANALVTAEKFVLANAEGSFIEQYGNALIKIRSVLRGQQKDRTDLLSSRISSAELQAASAQLQEEFLSKQPGYLQRDLLKKSEDEYIDIVHWASHSDAQQAMQAAPQHEVCQAYFGLMATVGDGP
ncbi:MAG: HTH domain-containing protein [Bacteroidota bacterium]